jgi:hypothetical protein
LKPSPPRPSGEFDHTPFLVLLAAGILLRALVVGAYRPALLLQVDAYAYLNQAFGAGGSQFRPPLYPMVLRGLLVFGDLALVPLVQHVAGAAVAALAYALLRRLGVGPYLAAAGAAPLLLDGYQLVIEHYVLSETLFESLALVALLVLVWRRPSPVAAGASGALLALSGSTRFAGLALVLPALVYACSARLGWLRVTALVLAFGLALGLFSLWAGNSGGVVAITPGTFLLARVAPFTDCQGVDVPPAERPLCRIEPPAGRGEARGFFALDVPARLVSGPEAKARLLTFSQRMIAAHPLAYLAVVGRDFLRYFDPRPPLVQEPNVRRWRFPRSLADADPHPLVRRYRGAPPPELGLGRRFSIDRPIASALRSYQVVAYTNGLLLALFALVGVAGVVWGRAPAGGRDPRRACLLFTLSGLTLLLVPVVVAVHHFRYALPAIPLLGVAGALGASLLRARFREADG